MNRRDIPSFRNLPINDSPYDNHISYYLTAFHDYFLLAMDNNQLITGRSDGNQVDLKSIASQEPQFLEEVLYPGMSEIVAMKIR